MQFKQILIAFDQFLNTLVGGYADETFSSRSYRWNRDEVPVFKLFKPVIDTLFFFDEEHCYNSYLSEREDRHLPPEFRGE